MAQPDDKNAPKSTPETELPDAPSYVAAMRDAAAKRSKESPLSTSEANLPDAPSYVSAAMQDAVQKWQKESPPQQSGTALRPELFPMPSLQKLKESGYSDKIITLKENNDNLVNHFNLPYSDGGIRSNQSAVSASAYVTRPGFLNGKIVTGMISATTFTSWPTIFNSEPAYKGLNVKDNGSAPNGEDYRATAAVNRMMTVNKADTLDLGLRTDFVKVSKERYIQDMWHDHGGASYVLSPTQTVANRFLGNVEATAAYTRSGKHFDTQLLSGTSLGNGYQGVMLGIGAETGTPDARYLPVTTHSAQFGNTNIEHTVAGWEARRGTFKISPFAKVYLENGPGDYRTKPAATNPVANAHAVTLVPPNTEHFGTIPTGVAYYGDTAFPQFNILTDGLKSLQGTMPAAVAYSGHSLNTELGVNLKVQLTKALILGVGVTRSSELVIAKPRQDFLDKIFTESNRLSGLGSYLLPFTDSKTVKIAYIPIAYGSLLGDASDQSYRAFLNSTHSPNKTYNGEISLHYTFKRDGQGR